MNKFEYSKLRKKFAENSIDELLQLLSAEDWQTRFFAEMCLRDATSTWLNFKPASSRAERKKAIEEWRDWLREREGKFKKKLKRREGE